MSKDFTATINPESARAQDWKQVFGSLEVPLRSPFPHEASAPGIGRAWFYEIDLQELTGEQRTRLIAHLAQRFSIDEQEVAADLDRVGCPILAEDVRVTARNPIKWV